MQPDVYLQFKDSSSRPSRGTLSIFLAKTARLIILASLMLLVPIIVSVPHSVFADTNHFPILINGNDAFTSDNGVTGGTGTSDDPYVISGWTIQAGDYGIQIRNTNAYFTITDVTVSCSPTNCLDGILFFSTSNGLVQDSHISVAREGIRVDDSDHFQITANDVHSGGGHVILLNTDSSFDVSYNSLGGGAFAISGSNLSDATITGNIGGAEDGIILDHFSGLLINQNSLRAHVSISVQSCGQSTIDSNTATAFNVGILVSDCASILVSNNEASTSNGINPEGQGISVAMSTDITVTSNTVSNNIDGILLWMSATGNTVTGNIVSSNQCGIRTDQSTVGQNYIADNTFVANTQDYCTP